MGVARSILVRMFGRPGGVLGRLGGLIMARTNRECAVWVIELLDVGPDENVLEVGFGPGVGIQLLAKRAAAGYVAGIDPSVEMVAQASARNAEAIKRGRVDLRLGSAASLPFADDTFDKAVAINSMQLSAGCWRRLARDRAGGKRRWPCCSRFYALFGATEERSS
jgi:SAM-dependent methyltransferase